MTKMRTSSDGVRGSEAVKLLRGLYEINEGRVKLTRRKGGPSVDGRPAPEVTQHNAYARACI